MTGTGPTRLRGPRTSLPAGAGTGHCPVRRGSRVPYGNRPGGPRGRLGVPIIGGLPAVEGPAWDIGAPRDERSTGLAEELGSSPGPPSSENTSSSSNAQQAEDGARHDGAPGASAREGVS